MKRTILYRRTSGNDQSYGFGLDTQLEKMKMYCSVYGYEFDAEKDVITDEAVTGTTEEREGLALLLALIQAGEVERVVVYKLDRMARRLFVLLNLYETHFEPNKVALVSVMEQFDTSTPMGRMFFHIVGTFAEYEKDMLVERMMNGRLTKLDHGDRATGAVPYGYKVEEVAGRKMTVKEQEEAATVALIRKLAKEFYRSKRDKGYSRIAAHLNDELGIKTRRGGKWYASTIKYICENSIYDGYVTYAAPKGEVFTGQAEHLSITA